MGRAKTGCGRSGTLGKLEGPRKRDTLNAWPNHTLPPDLHSHQARISLPELPSPEKRASLLRGVPVKSMVLRTLRATNAEGAMRRVVSRRITAAWKRGAARRLRFQSMEAAPHGSASFPPFVRRGSATRQGLHGMTQEIAPRDRSLGVRHGLLEKLFSRATRHLKLTRLCPLGEWITVEVFFENAGVERPSMRSYSRPDYDSM